MLAHISHGADSPLVPVDAFIDCMSLSNSMSASRLIQPKVNAAVAALRDMYAAETLASLTWVPAVGHLADPLPKSSSSAALRAVLRTGVYGLRPVGLLTKTHVTDRGVADAISTGGDGGLAAVLRSAGAEFFTL